MRSVELRQCDTALGCGLYHSLAPALHELGFFLSYERYSGLLRSLRQGMPSRPRVLVAGAESEWSVRALLEAIGARDERDAEVVVFDRCGTPLRRIQAMYAEPWVRTSPVDIHTSLRDLGEFDLLVADSFVKQFPPDRKREVLSRLAERLRPGGALVLREYLGTLPVLLDDFWGQLPARIAESPREDLRARLATLGGTAALDALRSYMNSVGSTWPDETALRADLAAAGLGVRRFHAQPGRPWVVVEAVGQVAAPEDSNP